MVNEMPKMIMEKVIENIHNNLAFLIISMANEGMSDEKLMQWKTL